MTHFKVLKLYFCSFYLRIYNETGGIQRNTLYKETGRIQRNTLYPETSVIKGNTLYKETGGNQRNTLCVYIEELAAVIASYEKR